MKLKLTLGILIATVSLATSATVNVGGVFSATSGLVGTTKNNTPLTTGGYYIAVGSYSVVPTVLPDWSNLTVAVDAMNIFATGVSPAAAGNTQGSITGSFVSTGGVTPTSFNGKQIYFVIGNGTNRGNSTEFAILTTSAGTLFPADVTQNVAAAVTFSSINNSVVLENAGSEDAAGTARDRIVMAAPIPEPSTAALGLLVGLGLVARRRRA